MAGKGRLILCVAVFLLGLTLGLPPRGSGGTDVPAVMNQAVAMMPDCRCDHPSLDNSCPPAWCTLCPALLPAGLVMPGSAGATAPAPADELGHGLTLRPHPPPPRLLQGI